MNIQKVNWETTEYLVSILEEMVKGWTKGEGLGKLIYYCTGMC